MIPTTAENREPRVYAVCLHKLRNVTLLLVVLLLIQGCTNSKLIIGPLYNRLDDRIRDEFNKLGDFNEQQTAVFEATLGTYHVWHRQTELPQYADLMQNIASVIAASSTTEDDVQRWLDTTEEHSMRARECHPVNFLFDFMKSLTDEQLDFIENRFKREQRKNREKSDSRTPEERIKRRLRNIIKWSSRIGLEFTPTQRAMVLSTLKRQNNLREEYYALSGKWNIEFFSLARDRENPDYDSNMSAHLDKLWRGLETEHPDKWQGNRDLWKKTSLRFAQSMTPEQRETISRWLNKMADTLNAISQDKPSFQHTNDASLGCLINPDEA